MPEIQAASIRSKIAMGERKGQWVRRHGNFEFKNTHAELTGSLCAQINGVSLHAGAYCSPWQRDKLEKLCLLRSTAYDQNRSHSKLNDSFNQK